jgi:hypothetical protein
MSSEFIESRAALILMAVSVMAVLGYGAVTAVMVASQPADEVVSPH